MLFKLELHIYRIIVTSLSDKASFQIIKSSMVNVAQLPPLLTYLLPNTTWPVFASLCNEVTVPVVEPTPLRYPRNGVPCPLSTTVYRTQDSAT